MTMPTPQKKKGSKKRVSVKAKVGVRKKSQVKVDTTRVDSLPRATTKIPDNGATIKVKIRKKR